MKNKSFTTTGVNNLESLVPSLRQLGLSLNESKAYLCLLEKSGITAYEMSKNAGVPPSKIYDSEQVNLLQGFCDIEYNAANQTGSVGLTFQRMQICRKEGSEQRKGPNFLFAEDRR